MTSNEMIERVARAIDPDAYIAAGFEGGVSGWEKAKARARAAIEAMREPTQPMVNAGVRGWYGARFGNCTSAYVAMIDAALNAAPEDPETAP